MTLLTDSSDLNKIFNTLNLKLDNGLSPIADLKLHNINIY